MMIHAYPEMYLNGAQTKLGDAFDHAVNTCGISGSEFIKLFLVSSVSKRMASGEPAYVAGKSGIEIVLEQRNRDINKASGEILYCLAKVLGCTMEDLIEK